jgi:hypothetical protein
MDNHLPDLPTEPVPAVHQPRKRRRPWLLALLGLVGLLILCLVIAIIGSIVGLPISPSGHARGAPGAQGAQPGSPGSAGSSSTPLATQTASPTATVPPGATPQTGQPGVTYGRPHLGGPFSDFVGKYGPPTNQGDANSQNFWVGTDQTIDINVLTNALGVVTQLDVLGPDAWNAQQAAGYCVQFLPDKAVQFSATATQREYHSSVGTVVLTLQAHSCLLALARS